jgi:hypothetical protein
MQEKFYHTRHRDPRFLSEAKILDEELSEWSCKPGTNLPSLAIVIVCKFLTKKIIVNTY